ncbi:DUF2057 domain-containing protein [Thalassotalea sp. HSM 43]|nr:DUF2057 domain-containing protein [Thalassotalea sp. HSM 43]
MESSLKFNTIYKPLLAMALLFSSALSATELVVPDTFSVLRVNGEEHSTSFFARESKVTLEPGQNVVVLKYSELFDDDMEDHHTTIRSKPFILLFSIAGDEQLTFSYTKPIDSDSAKLFAKDPQVQLIDSQGKAIAMVNQSLASYEDEVMRETMNRRQQIVKKSLQSEQAPVANQSPQSLSMLKYWWQQASQQDKEAFLQYLEEQE